MLLRQRCLFPYRSLLLPPLLLVTALARYLFLRDLVTYNQKPVDVNAEAAVAFHVLARQGFRGLIKPPYHVEARARAGMGPEWYIPLATRETCDTAIEA